MDEVLEFLKTNPTYYLATVDEAGNPQVRAFGTITKRDDRLYIQTGKVKDVYRQIVAHPAIAICGYDGKGQWLRINATAIPDDSPETNQAILDEYPGLTNMYKADDGNCTAFELTDATATFGSFTEAPRTFEL